MQILVIGRKGAYELVKRERIEAAWFFTEKMSAFAGDVWLVDRNGKLYYVPPESDTPDLMDLLRIHGVNIIEVNSYEQFHNLLMDRLYRENVSMPHETIALQLIAKAIANWIEGHVPEENKAEATAFKKYVEKEVYNMLVNLQAALWG